MEKIKKFCVLMFVLVLLSACPAFAADPFEVHEGGFGPTIKDLQLGMPMTLIELHGVGLRQPFSPYWMKIDDIGQKGGIRLRLSNSSFAIEKQSNDASERLSQYKTIEELFEAVGKEGFSEASLVGRVCVINGKNRVIEIRFDKEEFQAGSMSHEEFAQMLKDAYHLPDLQMESTLTGLDYYYGKNLTEGWEVKIHTPFIIVSAITD